MSCKISAIEFLFLAVPILLPGQSAPAQDPALLSSVGGPVLGYVWEPAAHYVRPILGIPGASLLGPPLDLGFAAAQVAISPQHDYLLAVAASDGTVTLVRTEGGLPGKLLIEDATPGPDRIALSPAGKAAALYYVASGRIQILTGFPDAPVLRGAVDVSTLPGPVGALAISDDGSALLAGAAAGDVNSVYLLTPDSEARALLAVGEASAISFETGSHDALIADRKNNQIGLLQDVTGAAGYRLLAGPEDGMAGPVSVAASNDNHSAFAANADTGTVAELDLAGGVRNLVSCPCTVTGFDSLKGNSVFRLNQPSAGPLWLFDASGSKLRFLFVPPDRTSTPDVPPASGGISQQ